MLVIVLSLLASFLWASTNHIDKYLISKVTKNGDYKGLIIFSSFVSGLLILPIFLIITNFKIGIDFMTLIYVGLAITTSILAIVFYFIALNKNDTSLVVAIYQTIPVFVYILGLIFLKEVLTIQQIIGGLIILLSAIFITFDFKELKFSKEKKIALFLMLGSSILYALENLFFRMATIRVDFNIVNVWYNILMTLSGIILLLFKNFRSSFKDILKSSGKKIFGLNVLNDSIYQIANVCANYAMTITSMAIVSISSTGVQPVFAFIIGILGAILLPKIFDDDEAKKNKVQKISCILASVIGLFIFYL